MIEASAHAWAEAGFQIFEDCVTETQRLYLSSLDVHSDRLRQPNHFKRLWMVDAEVGRVACSPRVMGLLDALLPGNGYFLWGAQLIDRMPGQDHPWHCDIETWSPEGGFVSVWIGIHGTASASSLHVIPGSHRYPEPLQKHLRHDNPARHDPAGVDVLHVAGRFDGEARIQVVGIDDGAAIVFDGSLWHGSFHRLGTPRRALLLQYGRHGRPVRHIMDHRAFPFQVDERTPFPVLPLRGAADPTTNHNVTNRSGSFGFPLATIAQRPEPVRTGKAWTPTPYFQVSTPILQELSCHASELQPGFMPHQPHIHPQEEILVVLEGQPTLLLQVDGGGLMKSRATGPGDVHYYPAGHAHTIFNGSDRPVRYLMLRWIVRHPGPQQGQAFGFRQSDFNRPGTRFSIDRPASGLDHLHVHFTRLPPGEARRRHVDCYDTAILVLEGELSVLDRKLGPGGVFLTRAGELHDTCNHGSAACAYLVFELHAATSSTRRS